MASELVEIAKQIVTGDPGSKGVVYYDIYSRYFAHLVDRPIAILELGVYRGESIKVLATYFKNGKVIGIDSEDRSIDFSAHPNIVFARADQRDAGRLKAICDRHAPEGLDIIIDDAAHIGTWSLASYQALMPRLNPGGFYVVEDWGSGYWDDWPEGRRFQAASRGFGFGRGRIRSHDFGMVGFLKSLIDEVGDIAPTQAAPRTRPAQLEFIHVYGGTAVMKKAGGS